MRIHRFYIANIDIADADNVIVTQETSLIHQLKNVFRYKTGQILNIFNEKIGEIEVEIIEIGKKDMSFRYIRHIKKGVKLGGVKKRQVTLYMSIIKNSNFDFIVEKAVELGVSIIVPITTERTIKDNLNYERIAKIVKEATEQCGRVELMKVETVLSLNASMEKVKEGSGLVYFGSLDDKDVDRRSLSQEGKDISLFIGPEGGFSDGEMDFFNANGVLPVRLGDYVLRAETAAIVACGLVSL